MNDRQESSLLEWINSGQDVSWKKRAACSGTGIDRFFAMGSQDALRVCDICEVVDECLGYATEFEQRVEWVSGVYGGMTARQRRERGC